MRKIWLIFIPLFILIFSVNSPIADEREKKYSNLTEGLDAFSEQNYEISFEKLYPLAEDGLDLAQFLVGEMFLYGKGVKQDYNEAAKWSLLAAIQGNATAQYNIGLLYYGGKGLVQNYSEAAKWYSLSAKQGNFVAQTDLGVLYGNGLGVPQDELRAHMWSNIAARKGITEAIENRDIIANRLTPTQLNLAQEMAKRCLESQYQDC